MQSVEEKDMLIERKKDCDGGRSGGLGKWSLKLGESSREMGSWALGGGIDIVLSRHSKRDRKKGFMGVREAPEEVNFL